MPRPPIARRPAPAALGPGALAWRAPLILNSGAVDRLGVVRVAFDTVAADAAVVRLAADAVTREDKEALSRARADLARRSARAYAASASAFTRPEARQEAPPPSS